MIFSQPPPEEPWRSTIHDTPTQHHGLPQASPEFHCRKTAIQQYANIGNIQESTRQRIDKGFQALKQNPLHALSIAEEILAAQVDLSHRDNQDAHLLKVRALLQSGNTSESLQAFEHIPQPLTKRLLLTLGRALQANHRLMEALPVFQQLYDCYSNTEKDHKLHGLALARHYQIMGGWDNLNHALNILTLLRIRNTHDQADTPCNDKQIELTLGRLHQAIGGRDNLKRAEDIFNRLRIRASHGQADTPSDDKQIELTLGCFCQFMGDRDNLQRALDIITRLRTQATHGLVDTPCDDKAIEMALARLYQKMGGRVNQKRALDIYARLSTQAAHGKGDTPCDDKEVHLSLGHGHTASGNWQLFD